MRIAQWMILCGVSMSLAGCVVYTRPAPAPVVVEEGPVVQGPGVEVIEVEPPPAERVYIYDPGYPPGVYYYNNCYWYHGYRYERDVFVTRYVDVNVRERRYVNVEENRAEGRRFEQMHREEYARTEGHPDRAAHPAGPAFRPNENGGATHRPGEYHPTEAHPNERVAPRPGQTQGQPHPQPHPQQHPAENPPRQMGGRNAEQ